MRADQTVLIDLPHRNEEFLRNTVRKGLTSFLAQFLQFLDDMEILDNIQISKLS